MRIPLTKYGLPQVVILPAVILGLMACYLAIVLSVFGVEPSIRSKAWTVIGSGEAVLFLVLAWSFAFFRDPHRDVPQDKDILLSPADGVVKDIEIVEGNDAIGQKALRIGIFLSVFNVHVNRVPCAVRIEGIRYKKGKFRNAMSPECGNVNESNDVTMTRLDFPKDKLMVRQVSGAIARRIVCAASEGQEFSGGQRFGMIKFGSRTELYLPAGSDTECLVKIGQKVKAGLTPLVRYEKCHTQE
jgi:phosphatidylserine decarboxylase